MLPNTIPTVRVTARYLGPAGRPLKGTVTFAAPALLTFPDADLFIDGPVVGTLDENGNLIDPDGNLGVTLPATDAPGMNPSGWAYAVKVSLTGVVGSRTYALLLPADTPDGTVDLADVVSPDPTTPNYVPVAGLSAYQVAVLHGFTGSETDWLLSLKGIPGNVQSVNGKAEPNPVLNAADVSALALTGGTLSGTLRVDTAAHGFTSKSTVTANGHAITAWMAATSGTGSALNAVSDNPGFSAMQVSGKELDTGTIKVTHQRVSELNDAGAAALSIDLIGTGTAAQGIFINSTIERADGVAGTTGNLITVRNRKGYEDFKLAGNGRLSMGAAIGYNPTALVDLRMPDTAVPALVTRAAGTTGANLAEWQRSTDGAVRTRITPTCQLVTLETLYAAGVGLQVGGTSVTFGGGSGVLGLTNAATVPTTNPTGGGVLYAEGGALKWRSPNGVVTTIAPA
ncbi:hypothetical protein ACFYOA_08160 [Streptomyces iakyrus]|uniref:hypothetical protein n=1 Tax=Streptomyces iakyrus TaxID=68219 RepID=UPI0036A35B6A